MFIKCSISTIALVAALSATTPTLAQLDVGASVDVGGASADAAVTVGGDSGATVDANVSTSGGDSGATVDATVDTGGATGGDSGTSVDASVSTGGDSSTNVDADLSIGGANDAPVEATVEPAPSGGTEVKASVTAPVADTTVDATVTLGGDREAAAPAPSTRTIDGEVRLLALGEDTARLDVLITLLGQPGLEGVDLDAAIEDTLVSIVPVVELFNEDAVAQITTTLGEDTPARDELLAAIEASSELSTILEREGIPVEDVIAIQVADDGRTDVFVLPYGQDGTTQVADADIDLLAGERVLGADISVLDEAARVQLVIDLLNGSTAPGAGTSSGEVAIVNLDVLLGDQASAEVDAVIGGVGERQAALAEIGADVALQDALQAAGISPQGVVAIRVLPTGERVLFLDGAGSDGGQQAVLDLQLGGGLLGSGSDGGGSGTGATTADDGAKPNNGGGASSGTPARTVAGMNRRAGSSGNLGTSVRVAAVSPSGVKALLLPCGIAGPLLAGADDIDASAVMAAESATIVPVDICRLNDLPSAEEIAEVRAAIGKGGVAWASLSAAGFGVDHVIGASADDEDLVLYVDAQRR